MPSRRDRSEATSLERTQSTLPQGKPKSRLQKRKPQVELEGEALRIKGVGIGRIRIALDPLGPVADVVNDILDYRRALRQLEVEREIALQDIRLEQGRIDATLKTAILTIERHYEKIHKSLATINNNLNNIALNDTQIRASIAATMAIATNPQEDRALRSEALEQVRLLSAILGDSGARIVGLLGQVVDEQRARLLGPELRGLLPFRNADG